MKRLVWTSLMKNDLGRHLNFLAAACWEHLYLTYWPLWSKKILFSQNQMIYSSFEAEFNGEQLLKKEVYRKISCYWFRRKKCIAYTSIPQKITLLLCWSCQVDLYWTVLLNFIRAYFEGMYQHSKLVGRVSNPKLFIITLYYRLEKTISLNFFHFYLTRWEMVQCSKNLIIKNLYPEIFRKTGS